MPYSYTYSIAYYFIFARNLFFLIIFKVNVFLFKKEVTYFLAHFQYIFWTCTGYNCISSDWPTKQLIALFPRRTRNTDGHALLTCHLHVTHRLHSAFSSAQVKYDAEWSPSEVFFYDFWLQVHFRTGFGRKIFCNITLDSCFLEALEYLNLIKSKKTGWLELVRE